MRGMLPCRRPLPGVFRTGRQLLPLGPSRHHGDSTPGGTFPWPALIEVRKLIRRETFVPTRKSTRRKLQHFAPAGSTFEFTLHGQDGVSGSGKKKEKEKERTYSNDLSWRGGERRKTTGIGTSSADGWRGRPRRETVRRVDE